MCHNDKFIRVDHRPRQTPDTTMFRTDQAFVPHVVTVPKKVITRRSRSGKQSFALARILEPRHILERTLPRVMSELGPRPVPMPSAQLREI